MAKHARLAAAVVRRRLELGRTIEDVASLAGLTKKTITNVEHGRSIRSLTVWALDNGLDWEQGSAWAVFEEDGEPTPKDRLGHPEAPTA